METNKNEKILPTIIQQRLRNGADNIIGKYEFYKEKTIDFIHLLKQVRQKVNEYRKGI